MSKNSAIEWTDHTFNPWEGCQKIGPGCDHCYAEARNARFGGGVAANWGPSAPRRRTSPANWNNPLQWNRKHEAFFATHGRRQRVFCASLADVFDNEVPDAWRDDLATLILDTPNLDWLLLTKRIGNADRMLPKMFLDGPPPNIRLGASICTQEEADRDIGKLLRFNLPNFLSMEPLLGPIDLRFTNGLVHGCDAADYKVDWVIVGGESGYDARPMHPNWARRLRDQCAAAGVPFLFKQWGEWLPGHHYTPELQERDSDLAQSRYPCAQFDGERWDIGYRLSCEVWEDDALWRVGKKSAGRLLDGAQHDGFPEVA